jgi:hypothetical protein
MIIIQKTSVLVAFFKEIIIDFQFLSFINTSAILYRSLGIIIVRYYYTSSKGLT